VATTSVAYVAGSMSDPTFSVFTPAGATFPFVGAINLSTGKWNWLNVDHFMPGSPSVKSLALSGSSLLVVLQTSTGTNVMALNTASGLMSSPTVIEITGYSPISTVVYSGTSAYVALTGSAGSVLVELNMSSNVKNVGAANFRWLQDTNNNIKF
jgi:hypothetical protein